MRWCVCVGWVLFVASFAFSPLLPWPKINAKQIGLIWVSGWKMWRVRCEFLPFFVYQSTFLMHPHSLLLSLGWLLPFVAFSFSVNKVCTDNLFNTQFHWWGRGWVELTFLCTLPQPLLIHFLNTASGRFSSLSNTYGHFLFGFGYKFPSK